MIRYQVHRNRAGLTLLETLLALALSVVILAAVQNALLLHWHYRSIGFERARSAQWKLALYRDLAADFRMIPVRPVENSPVDESVKEFGELKFHLDEPHFLPATEIQERLLNLDARIPRFSPIDFRGGQDWFSFWTSQHNRRFESYETSDPPSLSRIIWFLNRGQTLSIPVWRNGTQESSIRIVPRDSPHGLTRIRIPILSDPSQPIGPDLGEWTTVDPHCERLEFRYSRDSESRSSWSDDQPPQQVHVTFERLGEAMNFLLLCSLDPIGGEG
ncbi:MAG: hypothetical protein KDA80_15085 [Planctomycetaceae bacterium]|nr:hypothetical protein [Planctomycetaceae bacterium]